MRAAPNPRARAAPRSPIAVRREASAARVARARASAGCVARRRQQAGGSVLHQFGHAAHRRGDHRQPRRHGLDHRHRQPFVVRCQGEKVAGVKQVRDVGANSQQMHALAPAAPDLAGERPIAGKQQVATRVGRQRVQQQQGVLLRIEARHRDDQHVFFGEAVGAPPFGPARRAAGQDQCRWEWSRRARRRRPRERSAPPRGQWRQSGRRGAAQSGGTGGPPDRPRARQGCGPCAR